MARQVTLIDVNGAQVDSLDILTANGSGGAVSSVFGRVGNVIATKGDYAGSQVTNDSGAAGATVSAALTGLNSSLTALTGSLASLAAQVASLNSDDIANVSGVGGATVSDALDALAAMSAPVSSVFGRTGAIVAAKGDYTAAQVTNTSKVSGAEVDDALNSLLAQIAALVTGVSSVFGRTGAVVSKSGDYAASQVTNDSVVSGAEVNAALNTLSAQIAALVTGVSSVFGRTGAVVSKSGDYAASQVSNDSGVSGAQVSNALNTLAANIAALVTGVSSVFGRTGTVTSKSGDYAASQVTNDSGVGGTGVSGALNTLATAYPPLQWGGTGSGGTGTKFFYTWYGQAVAQASETVSTFVCPRAGTLRQFRFQLSASVAVNWTATVRIGGVDSAVALTINSGGTVATDGASTITVAAGDIVTVKSVVSAADASTTSNPRFVCLYGPP